MRKPKNNSIRKGRKIDINDINSQLFAWGFQLVGSSEKSEAKYWAIYRDDEYRIRVASHSAVYESSCECYCIGDGPDDDAAPETVVQLRIAVAEYIDEYVKRSNQAMIDEAEFLEEELDKDLLLTPAKIASNLKI